MKLFKVKTKDLLKVSDLTREEIIKIFDLAQKLKKDIKKNITHNLLEKKSLAMVFEKNSTRTRISFEVGMTQLGGHALFLKGDQIQLERGESIADTAKVMSRYVDAIMIRTYAHQKVVELANNTEIPVINGLTDSYHPCQALTDYFTIYEQERDFSKIKLAYIGDGNNIAHSLLLAGAILGAQVSIATPRKYSPDKNLVAEAKKIAIKTGAKLEVKADIKKALQKADYLYTDVWTSMGQEKESNKRKKELKDYKISEENLSFCSPNCQVMHCLPAHRGEEIEAEIIDSKRSIIFEQAENRLHVQKAIMSVLISNRS